MLVVTAFLYRVIRSRPQGASFSGQGRGKSLDPFWLTLPLKNEQFPVLMEMQKNIENPTRAKDRDALTGLHNRGFFQRILDREVERAFRFKLPLILVNMVDSEKEARLGFERIRAACAKFLQLEVGYLGHVQNDPSVLNAVRKQTPFLKFAPRSRASRDIMKVADKLMQIRSDSMEHITAVPPLRMGEPVT